MRCYFICSFDIDITGLCPCWVDISFMVSTSIPGTKNAVGNMVNHSGLNIEFFNGRPVVWSWQHHFRPASLKSSCNYHCKLSKDKTWEHSWTLCIKFSLKYRYTNQFLWEISPRSNDQEYVPVLEWNLLSYSVSDYCDTQWRPPQMFMWCYPAPTEWVSGWWVEFHHQRPTG